MSYHAPHDSAQQPAAQITRKRRALIIGGAGAATLHQQLAESGYDAAQATTNTATGMIAEFAPDVAVIVPERIEAGMENEGVALARRLREEPSTHALPLALVYGEEERVMRSAALNIGVDDCFGIWTPHEQILARLDALFWRIETGRRAAFMTGDQRLEIDNFIVLLDAVREDMRAGASGTLALIYALPAQAGNSSFDKQARDRTLAEAHGFFKLNLRRIDSVGYYGPTTLLIYLPRTKSHDATATLAKLREEFLLARADSDLAIGLSSFPAESSDVEILIDKAEAAASLARAASAANRVVSSQAQEEVAAASPVAPPAPVVKPTPVYAPSPKQADAYLFSHSLVEKSALPVERESKIDYEEKAVAASAPAVKSSSPAPKRDEARVTDEGAAAEESDKRTRVAVMPRRLLLTVSDAAHMAQLNALIRSAGYEARTAFDGQQALDLLRIERPDLLLLDYELHGIDGVEMLRRLCKQSGGRLRMPVVMMMPEAHEGARHEALELGARSVVAMPYDPAELLDSVRRAGSVD